MPLNLTLKIMEAFSGGNIEIGKIELSVFKMSKANCVLKTFILLVLFTLFSFTLKAQLIGSPGSKQSAVQRCAPASYWITYTFEVDGGSLPSGYLQLVFRLFDSGWNVINSTYYYDNAILNQVPVIKSPDPPFNWVITKSHLTNLPVANNCEYRMQMYFLYDADGPGPGGYIMVDLTQSQKVSNWHTDDLGDGVVAITPPVKEVCEGDGLLNFRFQDASTFACTDPVALSKPNNVERFVQFVYGTTPGGAALGIPNLSINVYGRTVVLTTATGAPVANSWTVNPMNGAVVPPYSTVSGFFEGPVISTGPDPDRFPTDISYILSCRSNSCK